MLKYMRNITSVTHLTGDRNYTWLHYNNGTKEIFTKSLSYYEYFLPGFVRIHKSSMINPAFVECIQWSTDKKQNGVVFLKGGAILAVSRRRRSFVQTIPSTKADNSI